MMFKCPYCEYKRPDQPISEEFLRLAADPQTPLEDRLLWTKRLADTLSSRYYNGIKVHIGRKHKGEFNQPTFEFNKREQAFVNSLDRIHETSDL